MGIPFVVHKDTTRELTYEKIIVLLSTIATRKEIGVERFIIKHLFVI